MTPKAQRDILIVRGQRTTAHREARELGYGQVVDVIERLVPIVGDDIDVEVVLTVNHGHAQITVYVWLGERVYNSAWMLPPKYEQNLSFAAVDDRIQFEINRMLEKVGASIVTSHVEWKKP
jgi:hypothetical protein